MGLQDRPYWREGQEPGRGGGYGGWYGGSMGSLPSPPVAVKVLLIVNFGIFVIQILAGGIGTGEAGPLMVLFGARAVSWWQVWRYLTFQFLHAGIWHIGANMVGLYFLGTPLERSWGTRRFVQYYLTCGAAAGVLYVLAQAALGRGWPPLVGASGGVVAILLACALLFPHMKVILILFLVPIRLLAMIAFGVMVLWLLISLRAGVYTGSFWSQVAHFGGAAAGAVWIWVLPRARESAHRTKRRLNDGAWRRRMQQRQEEQEEIDRILEKIKTRGINSLSRKEKRMLSDATRRQREEEKNFRG